MILKKIIFLYQPYLHSYLNGIYPMFSINTIDARKTL